MSLLVMSDKTQAEHNESALPPIADMKADVDFCRSGPFPDTGFLTHEVLLRKGSGNPST